MSPRAPQQLLKMADLARQSGVPAPTIKHYIREGLLPPPARRTSRNMAYYDAAIIPRISAIKELQRTRFLPLRVIKELLDGVEDAAPAAEAAILRVLHATAPSRSKTRKALERDGLPGSELDWFREIGLVSPEGEGDRQTYAGDDLELVETLNAARKAGITREMLPPAILAPYVKSVRELVRIEVRMFREGVLPRAGDDVAALSEAATVLSERLVVLLRRKMLIPVMREAIAEEAGVSARDEPARKTAPKRAKPAKSGSTRGGR